MKRKYVFICYGRDILITMNKFIDDVDEEEDSGNS